MRLAVVIRLLCVLTTAVASLSAAANVAFGQDTHMRFRTPMAQALQWVEAARKPGVSVGTRAVLLDRAIAVFRRMLARNPTLARPRLELARAFFLKGQDQLAGREFDRVLAAGPPEPVKANIRRFQAAMRARRNWSLSGGLAAAPDTNIGAASDDRIVWLPAFGTRLPFRVNDASRPSSGIGLLVWGGGEYQHPLTPRLRGRLGINGWRREYAHGRFDRMRVGLHAGPSWLIDRRTSLSLLMTAGRAWQGAGIDHDETGLRLEVRRQLDRSLWLETRAAWSRRVHRLADWLDGPRWSVDATLRWQALPVLNLSLHGGYALEDTRVQAWRNDTPSVGVRASWLLPWGFTLGGSTSFSWTRYEPDWRWLTIDDPKRRDARSVYGVSLLHRRFTLGGFSPQFLAFHERRRSNAQLYDYRKWRFEARLVRQF
ncbi:MAG: porin family protein [Alphaproteobacteria bacterium]|nr:porin family protein [Alphaproteobacteria bacterium]